MNVLILVDMIVSHPATELLGISSYDVNKPELLQAATDHVMNYSICTRSDHRDHRGSCSALCLRPNV